MNNKRISGNDPTPRQFIKDMLPDHYEVKETMSGIISCKSNAGIETESEWLDFMNAIRNYFGDAFKEVYHSTCTNHVNFTVYYSYQSLYNLEDTETGGFQLAKTNKQKDK
jgi:hypothetical protein